jgi:hypothetical protein
VRLVGLTITKMNDQVRLVLTAEIAVTGEQIEGTLRSPRRPARHFSGWSELFAALLALTSEEREEAVAPDGSGRTSAESRTSTESARQRNHTCE